MAGDKNILVYDDFGFEKPFLQYFRRIQKFDSGRRHERVTNQFGL